MVGGMAVVPHLSFVPLLLTFWYQGPKAHYSELSEILFYLATGMVVSYISSRENLLQRKYQTLSEKLPVSYQRLHDQAARMVQAEKELFQADKRSLLGHISAPMASIKGSGKIYRQPAGLERGN
jgi:hypothetical protein